MSVYTLHINGSIIPESGGFVKKTGVAAEKSSKKGKKTIVEKRAIILTDAVIGFVNFENGKLFFTNNCPQGIIFLV